jgi:hypothetical protein
MTHGGTDMGEELRGGSLGYEGGDSLLIVILAPMPVR